MKQQVPPSGAAINAAPIIKANNTTRPNRGRLRMVPAINNAVIPTTKVLKQMSNGKSPG